MNKKNTIKTNTKDSIKTHGGKELSSINSDLNINDCEVELEKNEEDNAITYEIKIGGGGESAQ